MKKYVAEFIGSFFLVFVIVLVANNGTGALAPLAMGAILTVMAYAARDLSGAHFNPALSLAALMRGQLSRFDFPYYVVAQLLGAMLAALLATFLLRSGGGPPPEPRSYDGLPALLAEFFGSFALVYVVLNVVGRRDHEYEHHYGLALGGTAMSMAYALGGISGGAFNPAVAVGMAVAHLVVWDDLWIYLIANLLGAAAATSVFLAMHRTSIS